MRISINMMKLISGIISTKIIFYLLIAAAAGGIFSYANNLNKVKQLRAAVAAIQGENKQLKAQNEVLGNQINTLIKKGRELTNELLQLSEEKTKCYKTTIKYNEKLKKTSIVAPDRVEHLINNYYNRLLNEVAKATGT